MNEQLTGLQDRETVNADTARQFHLNAIDHLEKALAFHRHAVGSHDQGDLASAAHNTRQAQSHVGVASALSASATQHYSSSGPAK